MKYNRYTRGQRSTRDREWLPRAILSVVIGFLLIILIKILFYPDLSLKEDIWKPIAQRMTAEKAPDIPKPEPGEKAPDTETSPNRVETAPEKARTPEPPMRRYDIKDEDLFAFFPFNGNADDESGHENHGTVYGARPADDRFGNKERAYLFDGIDDYIDIAHPLVSGNFTIGFWIKSNGRQNQFAVPVSQGNMAYKGFNFTFTSGLYNGFSWGTWKERDTSDPNWGKSSWHTLGFNFPSVIDTDLTWHFLAATFDNDTVTVYRDGEPQDAISGFPINFGRFNFNIGRSSGNRDFNHRSFNGIIDDIRVYNRALSREEITDLYKNPD